MQNAAQRVKSVVGLTQRGMGVQESTVSKESIEPTNNKESRRSFLAKLGIGAAALAAVALPLIKPGQSNPDQASAATDQFPGEDSIFHPAQDPRLRG